MADDGRTYIRVHDGMPDHPKVDALTDRAFRLLVETWCWCSRHLTDGRVPKATWSRRGTPATRRELVNAGLAEDQGDGVQMHDYLEHQRSRAQVDEITAARRAAQQKASVAGNHRRWHEGPEGKPSADCPLCLGGSQSDPGGSPVGSDRDPQWDPIGSSDGTPSGSLIGIDRDREVLPGEILGGGVPDSTARDEPPPTPNRSANQRPPERCDRHAVAEATGPCRACGDRRQAAERWDAETAKARAVAVRACRWCNPEGWRIDPEFRHDGPLRPGVRCDHTPLAEHRARVEASR